MVTKLWAFWPHGDEENEDKLEKTIGLDNWVQRKLGDGENWACEALTCS
jgi:hypothetical protein